MATDKQITEHASESRGLRPRFDPTLNWGHLLTAGSFLLFGIGAWYSVKGDIDKLEFRATAMERSVAMMADSVKSLADKAVTDARQDERLNAIDRRVDRLEVNATLRRSEAP